MNQPRMSQGRTVKRYASPGGNEAIVWNRYSYQIPDLVGTNSSTNKKHNFYNSTVHAISRGGGDCAKTFGALCAHFVDTGSQVKTQVENILSKLFDFQG